jgi:multidrug efflux system membrane fusion protein
MSPQKSLSLNIAAQKILKTTISILLLGSVVYLSVFADQATAPAPKTEETLKRVRVAAVEQIENSREVRFPSVTRAAQRARLGFTLGGRLMARSVEVGDRVEAGDVLAQLDGSELRNAVLSAEGALAELAARRAQTERDRDRAERLLNAKATTPEELERTVAAVEALVAAEDSATARLRETQRRLTETELRAPFAGTVTDVLLEPGEHTTPGRGVVVLSGDGEIEVEIEVPESLLAGIHNGDEVTVRLPVLRIDAVAGRIQSVGRAAAGRGRLFPVVVRLAAHSDVAAGMTAELVLDVGSGEGALALPVEAIVNPSGRRPSVFRLVEATATVAQHVEKLRVEVDSLVGTQVIVHSLATTDAAPLRQGDQVVVGGQHSLLDGESVERN